MQNGFETYKQAIRSIAPLSEEDCNLFEDALETRAYKKGDFFLQEKQVCADIGFVHKGLFRMYYLREEKEINTHFFCEHDFVTAYNSFLSGTPARCYIQALENSELICFARPALEKAYDASHNWERFGRKVAEYIYSTASARTESFLFLNGEQRYLELLKEQPHYLDRIPLYHLASYLGLERESLSRLRRKIARK